RADPPRPRARAAGVVALVAARAPRLPHRPAPREGRRRRHGAARRSPRLRRPRLGAAARRPAARDLGAGPAADRAPRCGDRRPRARGGSGGGGVRPCRSGVPLEGWRAGPAPAAEALGTLRASALDGPLVAITASGTIGAAPVVAAAPLALAARIEGRAPSVREM